MSATFWDYDEAAAATPLLTAIRHASAGKSPDLAIILGSGWGAALDESCLLAEFPYRDWPCLPAGQVAGHAGHLKVVRWRGWTILAFVGRWHCYQGLSAHAVTIPVRLAAALGTPRVALTCAAGGIRPTYSPGDFMLVRDHLNCLGDNPLKGRDAAFVDLTALYRTAGFAALAAAAGKQGSTLHRGVLAAMPGPSYETPAEVDMLERFGADAVAMSTVPEAIMARALGLEVAALALIANRAAGRAPGAIEHAGVLACGTRAGGAARALLATLIDDWQRPAVVAAESGFNE